MGPDAALQSFQQFADCLADPTVPPDMSDFLAAKQASLAIFNATMDAARLDALVFPQTRDKLPKLHAGEPMLETTVCEINIAGLPGVTVPAGYHPDGEPFGLIFVGRHWSEPLLLGLAFDYEQATRHRHAPTLEESGR